MSPSLEHEKHSGNLYKAPAHGRAGRRDAVSRHRRIARAWMT